MDEPVLIIDVVGSLDFFVLIIIGAIAGLARSAMGEEIQDTRIVVRRVFLGGFWAMLVYLVQESMDREEYDLLPGWTWIIVIIIGAMYANEAIDVVKEQLQKRTSKYLNEK